MLPAAPVRFSMTTGWPHLRDSQSATALGSTSAVPPAGKAQRQPPPVHFFSAFIRGSGSALLSPSLEGNERGFDNFFARRTSNTRRPLRLAAQAVARALGAPGGRR